MAGLKKVLFVINTLGTAGAEKSLLELLGRLRGRSVELSLYVLTSQGELAGQLPEGVRLLNSKYYDVPVRTGQGFWRLAKSALSSLFCAEHPARELRAVLRGLGGMLKKGEVHPDKLLWHVFSEGAPELGEEFDIAASYLEGGSTYYVADRVRAAKKYAFVHIDYPSSGYTRELDRGCYGAFDRIFAVSEETRESFLRVYPEYGEKTLVFPNPIDREGILGRSEAPGGFEDGFGGFRLLTVGRLSRQKAYDVAVEAMAVLKQRGLPMRWYVLGEGEQRRALERKIARLGLERDFVLLGAVENPFPYYRQADIYVHATRYEGKSIAVQEAQILGCAVVVSDCCGNREQVTDGVDGLLCKLEPRDIADSIERLYRDVELRQRLSLAAERKAEGLSEDDGLLAWFC